MAGPLLTEELFFAASLSNSQDLFTEGSNKERRQEKNAYFLRTSLQIKKRYIVFKREQDAECSET